MFDHDDRIAQVAQILQGRDELVVVALVQADAGFVQNIQHTGQRTADLGGQADALALAAGQCACRAGQRQVIQTHALQKLQAVLDLLHDLPADLFLLFGQIRLIFRDEAQFIPDGHLAEFADVFVPDGHGQHHRLQAAAMAVRALDAGHEAADLFLHPLAVRLAEAALQIFDDALKGVVVDAAAELVGAVHLDLFAVGAVQKGVDGLRAHLIDGRIQRETVLFAQAKIVHLADGAFGVIPAAGLDGSLPDGQAPVGQDALLIHPHERAQTGALFAGTQRVVEGEQPGRQVADGDAVFRAGKVLAEGHALAADDIHLCDAAGQSQSCFQRVSQAAPDALAHGEAVHDDLHRVLDVLFQRDFLVEVIEIPVDADTGVAAPAGCVQLLLLGALALADDRSQHLKLRSFVQFQDSIHHFIHGLLADDPAADRAVRHTHAGI